MSAFFYTVGVSGSGKSTWAREFCRKFNMIYLSTDGLRGIIGENESDQSVSGQVFRTMEHMVEYFLKTGQSCLLDATSYSFKNRKAFIFIAKRYGVRINAYYFDTPLDVCIARNNNRDRKVPIEVIKRQYDNLSLPLEKEECDALITIRYIDLSGSK